MKDLHKYFDNDTTYQDFVDQLDKILSHVSFSGARKIVEVKELMGSTIVEFEKFKTMPPDKYYVKLSKVSKVTID